jgi:hypothetical protein
LEQQLFKFNININASPRFAPLNSNFRETLIKCLAIANAADLPHNFAIMLKIPPVFLRFLPVLCTKAIGAVSDKH